MPGLLKLILVGEIFQEVPKLGNTINWRYMGIKIRRRSVAIREILQEEQKKIRFVKFHIFGKENKKIWKIKKIARKHGNYIIGKSFR